MSAKVLSFVVEPVDVAEAAAAFLGERSLARTSRRVYALTLRRLEDATGPAFPVGELDAAATKRFLADAYPKAKPATWNRNVATLRSFFAFCRRQGWMVSDPTEAIERRRVDVDETRAIDYAELDALWSRRDVPRPGEGALAAAIRHRWPSDPRSSPSTSMTSTCPTAGRG